MRRVRAGDRFTLRCTVGVETYALFRDTFADGNRLHVDAEFARAKGFAGPVMHGNILGGFLSHLIGEVLPQHNVILHSQTIHFRRPVYLNDELLLTAIVDDVFESVSTAELSFAFRNARDEQVASGSIQIGFLE